ncbi:N-glycosylase/DNA lyase OGG1 isoform X1, partial [Tanacetum coccineum]
LNSTTNDNQESVKLVLLEFLNMGISLNDLWTEFSACDQRFADLAVNLSGARVLRQDPLECLLQFIYSSNNNITRITKMVDYVSCLGEFVGVVQGVEFYKFLTLE